MRCPVPYFTGSQVEASGALQHVCVGEEWHRFPSSFFLPSSAYRLRFVDPTFDGLLPRHFNRSEVGDRCGCGITVTCHPRSSIRETACYEFACQGILPLLARQQPLCLLRQARCRPSGACCGDRKPQPAFSGPGSQPHQRLP